MDGKEVFVMSERSEKAVELFKSGYNCSQAVFAAYADLFGFDEDTALKVSAVLAAEWDAPVRFAERFLRRQCSSA